MTTYFPVDGEPETCVDCDGAGKYPSGQSCLSCGGSGLVGPGDGIPRPTQMTSTNKAAVEAARPVQTALEARLKRELAARAIRTMGPRSPFWNCTICGAAYLTPLAFEHKPYCILADERPSAIVSAVRSFYSLEVQHAIMRDALEAIAELNHGTTGQAARAALEAISKKDAA